MVGCLISEFGNAPHVTAATVVTFWKWSPFLLTAWYERDGKSGNLLTKASNFSGEQKNSM